MYLELFEGSRSKHLNIGSSCDLDIRFCVKEIFLVKMKGLLILAVFSLSLAYSNAQWTDLKIKFGLSPFESGAFVSLPRTEAEAIRAGWKAVQDCSNNKGKRYVLGDDRFVTLVFTASGNIAGIASSIPKGAPFQFPSTLLQDYFEADGDYYTITAYFVDPTKICTADSSTLPFGGDRLLFKGKKEVVAPSREGQMNGFWTRGKCYPMMGNHWYDSAFRSVFDCIDPKLVSYLFQVGER